MTAHPTDHRKLWLEQLVKENAYTAGAELGVHEGVTLFHLLDTCPQLYMTGVDVWEKKQAGLWPAVQAKVSQYDGRCTLLKMKTTTAVELVEDQSLDFVFIDASHNYWDVLEDIESWRTKVRAGGHVTGHDINDQRVLRAVQEIYGDQYMTAQDNVWYTNVQC